MSNDNPPRSKMRPAPEAPPGLEQDGKGNIIPFDQRTKEDQEKAGRESGANIHNLKPKHPHSEKQT